jgi:hypothetical protein
VGQPYLNFFVKDDGVGDGETKTGIRGTCMACTSFQKGFVVDYAPMKRTRTHHLDQYAYGMGCAWAQPGGSAFSELCFRYHGGADQYFKWYTVSDSYGVLSQNITTAISSMCSASMSPERGCAAIGSYTSFWAMGRRYTRNCILTNTARDCMDGGIPTRGLESEFKWNRKFKAGKSIWGSFSSAPM